MAQRNRTAQGVLAALLAGTVALTACSPPTSASGSANSGGSTKALTVWLQQKPDTASALLSGTYGNSEILSVTQDQLVSVAADGTLEPRAATKWNLSADAKSLTLNLADQKWSDGSPFTADDVVFTLNLYTNPAVKSPLTTVLKPIAGYDEVASGAAKELSGVKKVDDHTVRIDLKNPDVGFMYTLFGATIYVLQKAALSKEDPATVASSQIWITPVRSQGWDPSRLAPTFLGNELSLPRTRTSANRWSSIGWSRRSSPRTLPRSSFPRAKWMLHWSRRPMWQPSRACKAKAWAQCPTRFRGSTVTRSTSVRST